MKANKIFAAALAVLTLVGFSACKKDNVETLSLDPTSMTLTVGQEEIITATVGATWTTSDKSVAVVNVGNDGGKTALVIAVGEGSAIITASANGTTKTCVVKVEGGGSQGGDTKTIEAAHIWPVILDAVTAETYASLISGDFRPNGSDNNLWIWASGETYNAGEGTGKNFFGNNEGYLALTVAAPDGWSGAGFCCENAESVAAMTALKAAIVENPDKYFLHLAIKSTNEGNHQFYTFGTAETSFNIGKAAIEKGSVIGDFTRDGEWHEFNVPMAQFANAIANAEVKSGTNILCFLSGATVGAQLNLDAVYFYEKK